jgi:hypothetical protein
MIDKIAANTIQDWQPRKIHTIGLRNTGHPEQKTFLTFAKEFSQWSDAVDWQPSEATASLPGFILKDNIIYSALPLEKELTPFLKGLDTLTAPALSLDIRKMLDQIQLPCSLTLYIALQCPHCPGMVAALMPMAAHCPKINLHIIDGSLFPDRAGKDKVMAAPCLILDKGFRWTGAVPLDEIVSMILNRDPSTLGTGTLKNILEAGQADWITREMINTQTIFDGFLGLLVHETWSVRLGAMVVVEALAEDAPDLAGQLTLPLIDIFHDKEIPVQGDILYALGEVGDEKTGDWIGQAVGESAHADIKDAAKDALEAIAHRMKG